MAVAATMQHTTVRLFIVKLPGDKFMNGILFGVAEVLSMIFSNLLLIYIDDILAFWIVFSSGIVSYVLVVYIEYQNGSVDSFFEIAATLSLMGSIGSWVNMNSLIMELRVPPNNIAAVHLLSRTIAVGGSILSPSVAALEPPYPYLILLGVSILGFLASFGLPKAGDHLLQVKTTVDCKRSVLFDPETDEPTLLHDFDSNQIVPPTPMIYHTMQHTQSYTEKMLKAQRAFLSINSLDPHTYLENTYISTQRSCKKLVLEKEIKKASTTVMPDPRTA